MSRIFLLSFFAMLSFQAQLTAQETVRGTVTNQEDVILPGAQVWLEGYEQQASTVNAFGDFLLPWPAGEGGRSSLTVGIDCTRRAQAIDIQIDAITDSSLTSVRSQEQRSSDRRADRQRTEVATVE